MYGESLAPLLFPEAAAIWLAGRKKIAKSSRQYYQAYIAALTRFFGEMRLADIGPGNLAAYQKERQAAIRATKRHRATNPAGVEHEWDGAQLINHEVGCLQQVLVRAGLWDALVKFYEPLPLPPEGPGIAVDPDEERHWFQTARSEPRWEVAYYASLLSRGTTAGPGEIRHLRLKDVRLDLPEGPLITVLRHIFGEGEQSRGVKNEFRERPLPLNLDAEKAVRWMWDRATAMGCCQPHHYLLPGRLPGGGPDPARPMGSWKKAHEAICREAGKKYPRLLNLRPYDFRHTAATDLMEDPTVSWATIEHMMGHRINSKTKRKYDHVRNEKLRSAAKSLQRGYVDVDRPAVEVAIVAPPAVGRVLPAPPPKPAEQLALDLFRYHQPEKKPPTSDARRAVGFAAGA
jgi:integrase